MAGSRTFSSLENLAELVTCYICTEKLCEAAMCPHCSQIGCLGCVRRWIDSKKECPHCREAMLSEDLIMVSFFDKLVATMLEHEVPGIKSVGSDEVTMCSEHERANEVYCARCKVCICSYCALWGKHQGHEVEKADDFYKKQKAVIEKKLQSLKECLVTVLDSVEQVEKRIYQLKRGHMKTAKDIKISMTELITDLEKHTKGNMRVLEELRHKLENEGSEITALLLDLQNKMKMKSYQSLFTQSGDLNRDTTSKLEKIRITMANLESIPPYEPAPNMILPPYVYGTLTLHPFQTQQNQGSEVYSEPLHVDGMTWRLKVYPNGHKEEIGKYLSVFIELTTGFDRRANYQYIIIMQFNASDKCPHKHFRKEYVSDFTDGESWGYRRYHDLGKLKEEGFLKNDTLVLQFGIRATTYCQKYNDLNLYVQKLEKTQSTLKQKVSELKQQQQGNVFGTLSGHSLMPQASPSHASSRSGLQSRHSHSSHSAISQHHHSFSDDFSRDYPRNVEPEGLRRSHHVSTHQLPSPSHSSRHGSRPMHSELQIHHHAGHREQRRKSADPASLLNGQNALPGGGVCSLLQPSPAPTSDDAGAGEQLPRPPKITVSTLQLQMQRQEGDTSSQPLDLEDIKPMIDEDNNMSQLSLQTVIARPHGDANPLGEMNSQPNFGDNDTHMYGDDHMWSQTTNNDFENNMAVYEQELSNRRDMNLSQTMATSTMSTTKRKSYLDLPSLTAPSAPNLPAMAQASQSMLDISVDKDKQNVQMRATQQQGGVSGARINRRDSLTNTNGAPGLSSTVAAAMWSLKKSSRSSSSSSISNLHLI